MGSASIAPMGGIGKSSGWWNLGVGTGVVGLRSGLLCSVTASDGASCCCCCDCCCNCGCDLEGSLADKSLLSLEPVNKTNSCLSGLQSSVTCHFRNTPAECQLHMFMITYLERAPPHCQSVAAAGSSALLATGHQDGCPQASAAVQPHASATAPAKAAIP